MGALSLTQMEGFFICLTTTVHTLLVGILLAWNTYSLAAYVNSTAFCITLSYTAFYVLTKGTDYSLCISVCKTFLQYIVSVFRNFLFVP